MATRYASPMWHEEKDDGTPASGWKLNFYEVGTTTRKTTYTTESQAATNANPVVLDSRGEAPIWLDGAYKVVLTDENDAVKWTVDDWPGGASATGGIGSNMVENASFETDTSGNGNPDNWTITPYSGGTVTRVTSDQQHGVAALRFTSTGTGGGVAETVPYMEVSTLDTYLIGFEIKSSVADVLNKVEVDWYTAGKVAISSTTLYSDNATNPTSWTKKLYPATAPVATAAYARLKITGCDSSDTTSGNVLFDNMLFQREEATFLGLTDTPSSMSGKSLQFARVNSGETALEFATVSQTSGGISNLAGSRPSTSTVTYTANHIELATSAGVTFTATSVSVTPDITASGADGLDTNSEANSTWYSVWVIYNGTTVAGLLSTSSTAPTMPSGYTYKRRVGAVYNDGSGNLVDILQYGNRVAYVTGRAANTYETGAVDTPTLTSPQVPSTAIAVLVGNYGATNNADLSIDGTNTYLSLGTLDSTGNIGIMPLNSSQQHYYKRSTATGAVALQNCGYLDNL